MRCTTLCRTIINDGSGMRISLNAYTFGTSVLTSSLMAIGLANSFIKMLISIITLRMSAERVITLM